MSTRWFVASVLAVCVCVGNGVLIKPTTPTKGWNSFDVQVYNRNHVGYWNESVFREIAQSMVDQGLVEKGYDTIVIDGGWSGGDTDGYGRNVPDVTKWPSAANGKGFGPLASWTHSLGLKFGIWHIRGVPVTAVQHKEKVIGTPVTVDEITYDNATCPTQWCLCTWDPQYAGVDPHKPYAQTYYNSLVDQYAAWGVDLLKWDCLYDNIANYSHEETLVVNAVEQSPRPFLLSLSPGGGMKLKDAEWIAQGQRASYYRITGDFHAYQPQGLAQHAFAAANFSSVIGLNATWPDLDLMDLGVNSPWHGTPTARLHAALWMQARSPLMFSGRMPASKETLNLIANDLALDIHSVSSKLQAEYQGDCSCKPAPQNNEFSCMPYNKEGSDPCVAVWWSDMPNTNCRALGVYNIGNKNATSIKISLGARFVGETEFNVTNVYDGTWSKVGMEEGLNLKVDAQGGELFLVASKGLAEDCKTPM